MEFHQIMQVTLKDRLSTLTLSGYPVRHQTHWEPSACSPPAFGGGILAMQGN